jgi:hypothetical protein
MGSRWMDMLQDSRATLYGVQVDEALGRFIVQRGIDIYLQVRVLRVVVGVVLGVVCVVCVCGAT